MRFPSLLDSRVLRRALADVIARHEALRTLFPERDDAPAQVVLTADEAEPDLFVAEIPRRLLDEHLRSAARMGFALETDPPLRAHLFQLPDDSSVLLLVLHHIAADGWSLAPLAADLSTAYRDRAEGVPRSGTNCPYSTPTTRCGSASSWAMRMPLVAGRPSNSPTGKSGSPTCRTNWPCRTTGPAP